MSTSITSSFYFRESTLYKNNQGATVADGIQGEATGINIGLCVKENEGLKYQAALSGEGKLIKIHETASDIAKWQFLLGISFINGEKQCGLLSLNCDAGIKLQGNIFADNGIGFLSTPLFTRLGVSIYTPGNIGFGLEGNITTSVGPSINVYESFLQHLYAGFSYDGDMGLALRIQGNDPDKYSKLKIGVQPQFYSVVNSLQFDSTTFYTTFQIPF